MSTTLHSEIMPNGVIVSHMSDGSRRVRVPMLMSDAGRTFTADDDSDPTGQKAYERRQREAHLNPPDINAVSFPAPRLNRIDVSGSTTNGQAEYEARQRSAFRNVTE